MNDTLLKSILGKFEKSFYSDNGFQVYGSAIAESEPMEQYGSHILRYLGPTFTLINRFLNKKDVNYLDPNDDMYDKDATGYGKGTSNFPLENIISDIFNLVKDMQPMDKTTLVYRGTFDNYYPELDDALVGETLSLRGVTSTSTNPDVANCFAYVGFDTPQLGSLIFKIITPSGMPCIKVSTEDSDEDEVILHPAKYRIENLEMDNRSGVRTVTLTPTELLDIKKLILEGLNQAKENQNKPINKWVIDRNKENLSRLKINPDTAIDDLINRVINTASPSPKTNPLDDTPSMA